MGKIGDILNHKGGTVHTVGADEMVLDAVQKMVSQNVGSLLVIRDGEIAGIVTERDYLREVIVRGRTSKETPVRDIMTGQKEVVCVSPTCSLEEGMAIMTDRRIRHLPVIDEGQLVGIVSIGDIVKQLSREQKAQIQYLTDYITGKYPA
jgi:CBS domain-containing protein